MTTNPYIGSSLDELLEEDGILEEVDAIAIKRVLACLVQELMQEKGLTKTAMAQEMNTRSTLYRNLQPLHRPSLSLFSSAVIFGSRYRTGMPSQFRHRNDINPSIKQI